MAAGQFYGGNCFVENLILRFLQFVLEVDRAGGDEGMNARTAGVRQGLGGALYVERAAARQRGHLRPRKLAADGVDGFEIALRGDGKARFQDVHAELD